METSLINHVQQNEKDCALACLAMVTGRSLEDIHNICTTFTGIGVTLNEEVAILETLKFAYIRYFDASFIPGRVFIITVPSLNFIGIMHRIVIDYYFSSPSQIFILDPNKGKDGRKWYETFEDLKGWSEVVEIPLIKQ